MKRSPLVDEQLATSADEAPAPSGARRGLVLGLIGAALVLFCTMVGILYYFSWLKVAEATSTIVVQGDKTMVGAVVTITGDGIAEPATGTFAAEDQVSKIAVPPGFYNVKVQLPDQAEPILLTKDGIQVRPYTAYAFDLTQILKRGEGEKP